MYRRRAVQVRRVVQARRAVQARSQHQRKDLKTAHQLRRRYHLDPQDAGLKVPILPDDALSSCIILLFR